MIQIALWVLEYGQRATCLEVGYSGEAFLPTTLPSFRLPKRVDKHIDLPVEPGSVPGGARDFTRKGDVFSEGTRNPLPRASADDERKRDELGRFA